MRVADWLINLWSGYLALGVVFAIAFVTRGIGQVDPVARGSKAWFRLIVLPGAVALWPLLLIRWMRVGR
jgi:uncharacterized membrane protein YphA (DoxX/SURF4 family)